MESSEEDFVVLEIQKTPIKCSRSTLIQNSDYFKVMFEGNFIESSKNTVEIQVKSLNHILEYI